MMDPVMSAFLEAQARDAVALSAASDIVEITPVDAREPHQRWVADFRCRCLVLEDGVVRVTDRFLLGVFMPSDYLLHADPAVVLTVLHPHNAFHPNIHGPLLCLANVVPGTPLVELVQHVFEMITLHTFAAADALNPDAAAWVRNNRDALPIDPRPLRRRARTASDASSAVVQP